MKSQIYIVIVLILFTVMQGCVTVDPTPDDPSQESFHIEIPKDDSGITNIRHVYLGMNYKEVVRIMGDEVIIGYEVDKQIEGVYNPITISNPHKLEVLRDDQKTYEIVYYFSKIVKADGIISDDELTPLVFFEENLVGKGWDYLFRLREKIK